MVSERLILNSLIGMKGKGKPGKKYGFAGLRDPGHRAVEAGEEGRYIRSIRIF